MEWVPQHCAWRVGLPHTTRSGRAPYTPRRTTARSGFVSRPHLRGVLQARLNHGNKLLTGKQQADAAIKAQQAKKEEEAEEEAEEERERARCGIRFFAAEKAREQCWDLSATAVQVEADLISRLLRCSTTPDVMASALYTPVTARTVRTLDSPRAPAVPVGVCIYGRSPLHPSTLPCPRPPPKPRL